MLAFGVVVLGVTDRWRAEEFWCTALGCQVRDDGFGGWASVLVPPDATGTMIALQTSQTPPEDHPRLHLDLHVADAAEQQAEAARTVVAKLTGRPDPHSDRSFRPTTAGRRTPPLSYAGWIPGILLLIVS